MATKYPSRTVRACLDTMRSDEEFAAFARMLTSPPKGVKVKRATPDELKEIRDRLERIK